MYSRVLTSLVAVWAILLGPTLCVGGWLDHPCAQVCPEAEAGGAQACCPCESNREREGGHEGRDGHGREGKQDGRCAHEGNCLADPCSKVARPENESDLASDLHGTLPVPVWPEWATFGRPSPFPTCGIDRPPNGHHLSGRPYPDRDLPLLI